MAANWELQLITTIVRGEKPRELYEAAMRQGLNTACFEGEARPIWSRIDEVYRRPGNFGVVPSEESLRQWFPHIDLPTPLENFLDLCESVRTAHMKREIMKAIEQYEQTTKDPSANAAMAVVTLAAHIETTKRLSASNNTDASFRETIADVLTSRRERTQAGGLIGLPWPWERMNADTQGIHDGDFILVWALPKSMKTFFGLVVCAHLYQQGHRVLIYSKEMTQEILWQRLACIMCKIDYDRLKRGALSADEHDRMLRMLERLTGSADVPSDHRGEIFFTQADRLDGGPGGPAEIRQKIDIYHPEFVMLDSSYMLELPGSSNSSSNALDWKNLGAITRELKQICKSTKIGMMAIMQENETQALKNKGSRGTSSLAMNKGAVADCDVGLRLVINQKTSELSIHYAVIREAKGSGFTIHAEACENFEFSGTHLHNIGDDVEAEQAEREATKKAQASSTATTSTRAVEHSAVSMEQRMSALGGRAARTAMPAPVARAVLPVMSTPAEADEGEGDEGEEEA